MKTALISTLILLILLCLVPSASVGDYVLEGATKDITIDPSGIVHVEESISYTFDGDYKRVYRELEVSSGESIRNIEGDCSESGCTFRVEMTPEGYRLIGELPESTPDQLTFLFLMTLTGRSKFIGMSPSSIIIYGGMDGRSPAKLIRKYYSSCKK